MHPRDLEPEIDDLLLRLVPELAQQWKGATPDEIDAIEAIAGRPLPRFYRWFLMRMGHDMGPLAYPLADYSVAAVLACHAERLVIPHPRFLMIGYSLDEVMPLHMFYDFEHPAREDARVTLRHALGGALHDQFSTFREMLAWGNMLSFGINSSPQRCKGMFIDREHRNVLARLEPVMTSLQFAVPIATGRHCGIFECSNACMITTSDPSDEPGIHVFRLGGPDQGRIRRILGEIATETSLEIEIDTWDPPI